MAEHVIIRADNNVRATTCPFYTRLGACRHGDRCSRIHNKPTISRTLLLSNMYQLPGFDSSGSIDPLKIQDHFEDFYEDVFEELRTFGQIEALYVSHNLAPHLIGNVYVLFKDEDHAVSALQSLRASFYCGRPIMAHFCPVTDFRRVACRQFEENKCTRGAYNCKYMHLKLIARDLRKKLYGRTPRPMKNIDIDRRGGGGGGGGGVGDYCGDNNNNNNNRDIDLGRPTSENHGAWGRRESRSPINVREGSEERRARIEEWNRDREKKSH